MLVSWLFCSIAIPPRVTEEADRMMRKLRDLQGKVDERASEVARKESQMHMLEAEKDSAIKRLRDAEGEVFSIYCQNSSCGYKCQVCFCSRLGEEHERRRATCEMREGKKNKYIIFSFPLISRLTFSCFFVG